MSITRKLAAGAALLLIAGLGPRANAPPRTGAERGVRLALIRMNTLLAARDMALAEEFAKGEGALVAGALVPGVLRSHVEIVEHYRRLFERPETFAFSWREVRVDVRGTVAWLFAEGELIERAEGKETRKPYRLTGVLELAGTKWRWRQFHGAYPASA